MELIKVTSISELPSGKTVLYGAGGYGRFVLEELNAHRKDVEVVAFCDDRRTGMFCGLNVGSIEQVEPFDYILITSSYWKDISKKLGAFDQVFNANLLAGKSEQEVLIRTVQDIDFSFYTPNKFLEQVSANFERIEPNMIEWINTFPLGCVMYDIGASNGVYGIFASILKHAEVVAFEPDVQNFAILDHNHYLNNANMSNFVGMNMGLGEHPGFLRLKCQEFLAGAHGKVFEFGSREQQGTMQSEFERTVRVETLDRIVFKYKMAVPEYLKIDVDGAEEMVLNGAVKLLSSGKVVELMIETEDDNISSIEATLNPLGYELVKGYQINEIILTPVSGIMNYLFKKK